MRHIRHTIPVIGLYELISTMKMNMIPDRATPIIQANFFCLAPTYSGTWFRTISRPMISEGEYLGLTNTLMMKSVRNMVIAYLASRKSPLKRMSIKAKNITRNNIPAAALISRSFKTGMLYPSTVSPNCITFFIVLVFWLGYNWMIYSSFCYENYFFYLCFHKVR